LASDNKLDDSGSLLMKSSGEQRGTGAGTNGTLHIIKMRMKSPFLFVDGNVESVGTKLLDLVLGSQMEGLFFCVPP
jgi:hypothetical protein